MVEQQFAARLGQGELLRGLVGVGVEHVEQRAVAHLVAGAGGVQAGAAGGEGGVQRTHAFAAQVQAQPGAVYLLRHLFALLFQRGLGGFVLAQAVF